MSTLSAKDPDPDILRLVIENVFMPPKLPQEDHSGQIEQRMNVALCGTLVGAALDFLRDVPSSQHPLWMNMIKMMELAGRVAEVPFEEAELQRTFSDMAIGGTSILPVPSSIFKSNFFIRRIFNAYPSPERRSHCAPTWQLCTIRGVRSLATEYRRNVDQGKAFVLVPRSCNPDPHRYIYG